MKQRLNHFLHKRLRAHRLGVRLGLSRNFRVPTFVHLNGVRHRLKLPNQVGVKVAFMELLLGDCYGLEEVTGSVKTVLDIGANVGLFCVAARQAFPDATIHAYEPNPHLERYLQVQARVTQSNYFMEAVDVEDGHITLDFEEDSVNTRSQRGAIGTIPAVALHKTIERAGGSVDLAKVDCEGAEWNLWQDAESWKCVRNLSLEYHLWPDHTHEEARQVLERLGFTIKQQSPATDFGLILASRAPAS